MGRLKRSRISVRFIRVLNNDGSTKKYYKIDEKGKLTDIFDNIAKKNHLHSSYHLPELLITANMLNETSLKQQNSDELSEKANLQDQNNENVNSSSIIHELESSQHSSDVSMISSASSQDTILHTDYVKPNLDNIFNKSNYAEELLKIETFAPIASFLTSDSQISPFSSPSSPESNLNSDFTVDEVPLNLDLYDEQDLTKAHQLIRPSFKADQNEFGFNFPNFLTASSEEFPNLFSTW